MSAGTRAHQRGIALITAMFIVAIVAALATYLGVSQQIALRQAQNVADLAQADSIARGFIRSAVVTLQNDAKKNNTDDLTEIWAQSKKLPPLPVEGGFVTIDIVDAHSRFNLNNVWGGNTANANNDAAVFRNLLTNLNLDPNLIEALKDWIDDDSNVNPGGAEDLDYLNHDPPYRTANQPLASVDELRRIKGFTDEVVNALRPFVIALPEQTEINVNTAPGEVLGALTGLPASALAPIVARQADRPYTDVKSFDQEPQFAGKAPVGRHSVSSRFFIVTVDVRIGRVTRRVEALVQRGTPGQPALVKWQQRPPIQIQAEEKKT